MSRAFWDTSAIYAFLVAEDARHAEASAIFDTLSPRTVLVCSSFVVQETVALLQARIGVPAVRRFVDVVQPMLDIFWVDAATHARASAALLAAGQRHVSLTDWTSFEVMRTLGIESAFAFDPHFEQQGFTLIDAAPRPA